MHGAILILALLLQEAPRSLPSIPQTEYGQRRARLLEKLSDGVIVMEAERLTPGMSGIDANTPRFDYSYLTGYYREGDILVLVPGEKDAIVFTKDDPAKVKEKTGIGKVLARGQFEDFAKEVFGAAKTIYTRVRKEAKATIQEFAPDAELKSSDSRGRNLINAQVTRLRMIKSETEIAMMKKAADATNKAHLAAMRACRSGMNEGRLQKVIEDTFKAEGMDGLGFPSIVGSGKNGTILHYMENSKEIPENSLVVCDVGASLRGYVTDITRTLPTDGKFTEEQKEAYQCVLAAQRAAEKVLKPGATFAELEAAAQAVFKERDLTDWSYAHGKAWDIRHGLGHYVGLAVHDSGTYRAFEPGCVITIEPGYYNKDKGWGIRIEDIYLVTADGFERWSAGAPREVEEIERIMADRK